MCGVFSVSKFHPSVHPYQTIQSDSPSIQYDNVISRAVTVVTYRLASSVLTVSQHRSTSVPHNRPISGVMIILYFLLCLVPAAPKIFSPCELASEILQMTVVIAGVEESVNCSPEDVARVVCIASLHNFNTSYSFEMGNETAVGLFGIPSNFTKSCVSQGKSERFQDSFNCLTRSQFKRNSKNRNQPLISEIICNDPHITLKHYLSILKAWNMNETWENQTHLFYKRKVTCQHLDLDYLYVTKEVLGKIYRPGVLEGGPVLGGNGTNVDDDDDDLNNSCREMSYCMNSCKASGDGEVHSLRKHKGPRERKIDRFGRVVDRVIIVVWVLAVVSAIVAFYMFVRSPRRRGVRRDDWSRPILTAHFSE